MIGQIGGALIGGFMANRAAKQQRKAQEAAIQAQMAGFNLAKPFISDMYRGGTDALNASLDAGYYGGPTYAGLNQAQQDAINNMEGVGRAGAADATNFMNLGRGFGQNTADIFNRASQDMLGNAINYASSNADPLIRNAMRNDYRNLMENQLPQTGLSASATGNTNSSRRGTREAILERGFQDRLSDTTANIQNQLIDQSLGAQQNQLSNMTAANQNLGALYNQGLANEGAAQMLRAGELQRSADQGQMDADRAAFEGDRDFALDQYMRYNAGILNNAPQSVGQVPANKVDPLSAAVGGAMSGFGFGRQFDNPMAIQPAAPTGPSSYGNFMTAPQQRNYFGRINFGGNTMI